MPLLRSRLSRLAEAGAEVSELTVFAPCPESEVRALEKRMGVDLGDFRAFLTKLGGFRFDWEHENGVAGLDEYEYGGNSEVGFVRPGGDEEATLEETYREFQAEYANYEVEDPDKVEAIRRCFPLFQTDGKGNALVVHFAEGGTEVHLLKAEVCWDFDPCELGAGGSLVGEGFMEFLGSWIELGAPSTECMDSVLEEMDHGLLDAGCEGAAGIKEWFGNGAVLPGAGE